MTRMFSLILVLGLTAPAFAETPAVADETQAATTAGEEQKPAVVAEAPGFKPAEFALRRIDVGAASADADTNSSRFREYNVLPSGAVIPYVRLMGNKKFWYDIEGVNLLRADAKYSALIRPEGFVIQGSFVRIPHRFGNEARTLLTETETGVWLASQSQANQDAIQKQFNANKAGVNFAFLNNLVKPQLAGANTVDLRLQRNRGQLEVRYTKVESLDLRVTYFNENRTGTRAAGTSFGFGNVVETPEPIQYRTQDYGLSAEYARSWGLLRGSFHYNDFTNRVQTETFGNPFRFTDASDASAYQAPGSASIAGARLGVASLPPDNTAATGSLGFLVKFKGHSRFTTDVSLGQWAQDSPFMPLTSNTAVALPEQGLPRSLDGKVKTLSLSSSLSSRPVDHLYLTARFRRYDLDNQTPRIQFPDGYVRFDGVFEDIPRITVPYGVTTDAATLSASYDFGKLTLEGGYKLDRVHRTFRETEKTSQNVGYARLDLRAANWIVLHGTLEKGSRGFSGLEIEQSEEASFLVHSDPVNLFAVDPGTLQKSGSPLCPTGTVCNLRYDQSEKDITRYGAFAELSPGSGKTTFTFSYLKGKDDFTKTLFGLTKADTESLSAEVDFTPSERATLYGFYSRENIGTFQRGRQSGATVSNNSIDDWTSEVKDRVNSFGAGATFGIVKDKSELKLFANYQRVDGDNAIASPVGGAADLARRATGGILSIPLFDDTKLYTLSAEVTYKPAPKWVAGLGGWYQYYTLLDANTTALPNYVPGSFFLAPIDSDYKGHMIYARVSYIW